MKVLYDNGLVIEVPKEAVEDFEKIMGKYVHFRIGQRFRLYDMIGKCMLSAEYILAQVKDRTICLISLKDGNRWRDSIKIENIRNITGEEMSKIIGKDYCIIPQFADH